jgi:stress response protein YsnF/uncharacterized membrane protein
MAKTVVGLFDNRSEAESVVDELVKAGFDREKISVAAADTTRSGQVTGDVDGDDTVSGAMSGAGTGAILGGVGGLLVGLVALAIPGVGPIVAAGPLATALAGAGIGAATGGLIGALSSAGVPDEEATLYAEGVSRGGTLVMVEASDDQASTARQIMERYNVVDIDTRSREWQTSGSDTMNTTGMRTAMSSTGDSEELRRQQMASQQMSTQQSGELREGEEIRVPVVEEELQIGKREVEGGGVRVRTTVEETPVNESINLREERVNVETRRVDQPVDNPDQLFTEREYELTEHSEEAVVAKRARVIEEVVISKDVDQRTETISDSVRRTDVDVERTEGTRYTSPYETAFRENYNTRFANSGYSYEQIGPAYRFGSSLASDGQYSSSDWSTVEPQARQHWESRNSGTWEDMKDAVRSGWETTKSAVRGDNR